MGSCTIGDIRALAGTSRMAEWALFVEPKVAEKKMSFLFCLFLYFFCFILLFIYLCAFVNFICHLNRLALVLNNFTS